MKRIPVSDNFFLDEFIDPVIYAERGERSITLIDQRIVTAAQFIRDRAGMSVTINNWATGGRLRERGLRRHDTPTGARWSQHKYGRAIDINISTWTPAQMMQFMREYERELISRNLVTAIEDIQFTPSWLHLDCRFSRSNSFIIVKP